MRNASDPIHGDLSSAMRIARALFLTRDDTTGIDRLRLVPTSGQGIRDLARDGVDLLNPSGTAMAGDGPWKILRGDAVSEVRDMPHRVLFDHLEGLTGGDGNE